MTSGSHFWCWGTKIWSYQTLMPTRLQEESLKKFPILRFPVSPETCSQSRVGNEPASKLSQNQAGFSWLQLILVLCSRVSSVRVKGNSVQGHRASSPLLRDSGPSTGSKLCFQGPTLQAAQTQSFSQPFLFLARRRRKTDLTRNTLSLGVNTCLLNVQLPFQHKQRDEMNTLDQSPWFPGRIPAGVGDVPASLGCVSREAELWGNALG